MNPSTGSLRECKTLFDAYRCYMAKIKSYTAGPDSQAATEEKISSCIIHKTAKL